MAGSACGYIMKHSSSKQRAKNRCITERIMMRLIPFTAAMLVQVFMMANKSEKRGKKPRGFVDNCSTGRV